MIASGLTGTDMRPRPCREARSVSLRLEPAPHRQAVDDRRRDALAAKERVFDFRETQLQRIIFILGLFEPPLQLGNHIAHRYTCARSGPTQPPGGLSLKMAAARARVSPIKLKTLPS